jgi:DNA-binding XRE family transcriptional regulator
MSHLPKSKHWYFDNVAFVSDVNAACERAGVNKDELYQLAGLTRSTSKWMETGQTTPQILSLCVVCNVLELDPRFYLVDSEVETADDPKEEQA